MLHKIDATREANVTMSWIVNVALPQQPPLDLIQISTSSLVKQSRVYVVHSVLNSTYVKSLEWQHIFYNDVKF